MLVGMILNSHEAEFAGPEFWVVTAAGKLHNKPPTQPKTNHQTL